MVKGMHTKPELEGRSDGLFEWRRHRIYCYPYAQLVKTAQVEFSTCAREHQWMMVAGYRLFVTPMVPGLLQHHVRPVGVHRSRDAPRRDVRGCRLDVDGGARARLTDVETGVLQYIATIRSVTLFHPATAEIAAQ